MDRRWGCLLVVLPSQTTIRAAIILAIISLALFQAGLGVLQKTVVFPSLIADIQQAAANNGDHALVNRFGSEQVLERLRNGGVYGSLLLANIYALICGIGALFAASRVRQQPLLIPALFLCLVGVWLSGAKGAVIALLAGGLISWIAFAPRQRWWLCLPRSRRHCGVVDRQRRPTIAQCSA